MIITYIYCAFQDTQGHISHSKSTVMLSLTCYGCTVLCNIVEMLLLLVLCNIVEMVLLLVLCNIVEMVLLIGLCNVVLEISCSVL